MRRAIPAALLLALALVSAACRDEGIVRVRKLDFEGVTAVEEARLRGALATRQSSRLPWGRKYFFDRGRFDADLKRIEAFYADRGYPEARVSTYDVKLNDKQNAVDITVTVTEGAPLLITAIEYRGFDVVPPDHFDEMKARAPIKVGEPRDRALVVATHELAINELRDHGYPYAKVESDEEGSTADGAKAVTVIFTAEPGTIAYFGPIEINGNNSVGDNVIRRKLNFRPGDLYRRSVVQDTQRQLYGMELFQFVNIETLEPERELPEVRTRVTVAEGKHQRLNFGVGYGTEEHGRVDAEYHHVNFFGGARSAGAHGRYSSLDRGVRLDLMQPYVFSPHFSLGLEGQQWYTYTPAYRSVITGAKATLIHRETPRTSWSVSFANERNSSAISPDILADTEQYFELRNDLIAVGLDPTTGTQDGTLNAFAFDFQRSTADSLLDPHRGYQLAFHTESAGRWLPGSFNYYAVSADGRYYIPLGEQTVIASRLQVGNIDPAGDPAVSEEVRKNVPFSKKYFLGGAASVRGWGRYEISPLSGSGLPIGGNAMFAVSSELRRMLRGNLSGVLFFDAGNVWAEGWTIHLNDLRYAVGPGLRYHTPVGPVRFDFGWQINPIPGLIVNGKEQARRWRIQFSIGQAF
jgi:outer membrane protein assembly complex protein YaeT